MTIIQESFILPSKGLIYDTPINPEVKLRSMTTDEELLRLNPSRERRYENMASIIDSCIVGELPISSYDMCLGDFQFLMYKLRTVTYDNIYKVSSKCPYCLSEGDGEINLDIIPINEYDEKIKEWMTFTLPKSGKRIELNVPTPRMYDDASIRVIELKKKFPQHKGDFTLLANVVGMIKTVDGQKISEGDLIDFVKDLPLADTNLIVNNVDKITEAIGYVSKIEYECPICGLKYSAGFRITGEFFRPSL